MGDKKRTKQKPKVKKRINSCEKGKRGEREFSSFMRETWGLDCRRGKQYSGGDDSPDVVHGLIGVHIEVKLVEKLNLQDAFLQAKGDAGVAQTPIVAHKRNRGPWLLTFEASRLEDLVNNFLMSKAALAESETTITLKHTV